MSTNSCLPVTTLFPLLCLFLMNTNSNAQTQDPFKGLITFSLEFSDVHPDLPENYTCESHGDSMNFYFGEEGYFQEHFCERKPVQSRWFVYKTNMLYMNVTAEDTLYFYNARNTDFTTEIQSTDSIQTILGHKCRKYIVKLQPKEKSSGLPETVYEYWLALDLKIDPKRFEGFKDGGYAELMAIHPGLVLKQSYVGPYYTKTRIATSIEQGNFNALERVPEKEFIRVGL